MKIKSLLWLPVLFLLAGCGSAPTETALDIPLTELREEMISALGTDSAVRQDPEQTYLLYGISPEDCMEEAAFYVAGATFSEEVILARAVDGDAAGRVREMLQSHLDSILDQTRNYDPAGYEIARRCAVQADGNYVWLLISARQEELSRLLSSHLTKVTAGQAPVYTPVPVTPSPEPEATAAADASPVPWGLVPESAPAEDRWFDDALVIGNSVAHNLDTYVALRRSTDWPTCMGRAKFFAGDYYSFKNAAIHSGTQPTYKGEYPSVEEVIADTGAKKIYLVLAHVDLIFLEATFEESIASAEALIDRIQANAPDVTIYVCSMTPRQQLFEVQELNSRTIPVYNAMLLELAERKNCYYLDCYAALADENGYLPDEFCAEQTTGGIHLTDAGCAAWLDYLYRHTAG